MEGSNIDIDIPTGKKESHSTPEDVRAAVKQAFQAGVPGILLSRKYSEMRLANLSAAGSNKAGLILLSVKRFLIPAGTAVGQALKSPWIIAGVGTNELVVTGVWRVMVP